MKFKFEIECDNDAFYGDGCEQEVNRILMEMRRMLMTGDADAKKSYTLRDLNGNTVGTAKFEGKRLA